MSAKAVIESDKVPANAKLFDVQDRQMKSHVLVSKPAIGPSVKYYELSGKLLRAIRFRIRADDVFIKMWGAMLNPRGSAIGISPTDNKSATRARGPGPQNPK